MLPDIRPGNTKILYFFNCLLDGMHTTAIIHCDLPKMPALTFDRNLGEISMEKEEFASYIKDYVKGILKYKPDAVYVEGELFIVYPVIRVLHKKHIPVYIKHQNGVVAI